MHLSLTFHLPPPPPPQLSEARFPALPTVSSVPTRAGTSSLDQLWHIVRCLGPLSPQQAACVAANPHLQPLAALKPPVSKTLRQRLPHLEPRLFQVVEACLRTDPRQRPTARELLQLPYFWCGSVSMLACGVECLLLCHKCNNTLYGSSGCARVCLAG